MPAATTEQAKSKQDIIDILAEFYDDITGFVFYAYPWGKKGTFLEKEEGPDSWQLKVLQEIDKAVKSNLSPSLAVKKALQIAVRSGQTGVGKTALISWIIQWYISTRPNPQIVVTANTETQLNTKTWRELAKWHNVFVGRELYRWTATRYAHIAYPATWFAAAIPWSENNAEAFAGTHDAAVLFIFDEGSAIPQIIYDNVQASMNAPEAMWFVFGNPTRNSGPFFDIFGKQKHRWNTMSIDARDSSRTDKALIQGWIDDWGEDSDFVRIRVKGIPPRASSNQFIGQDLVDKCGKYKSMGHEVTAKIMGVDVARYGDCKSVIIVRQGRKVYPAKKFQGKSTTDIAHEVIKEMKAENVDYCIISGVGVGAGTVDYLNTLGYGDWLIEVGEGDAPIDKKYFNKRAEMWGLCRDWLTTGGELPNDPELRTELTSIEYGFGGKDMKIQIETKESMRHRSLPSPDTADALTLTFGAGMTLPKKRHDGFISGHAESENLLPRELRDNDRGRAEISDGEVW